MTTPRRQQIALTVVATMAALAVLGAAGGTLVLYGGYYNVAATRSHFQWVHSLLELGLQQSVRHHARDVAVPAAVTAAANANANTDADADASAGLALRGAGLYRDNCVVCHGAPGVAQGDIGKSMQPIPGPLADAARRWNPNELYWITRHGIKMSGMPAWEHHMDEQDLWATVAFLAEMPRMTQASYRDWMAEAGAPQDKAPAALRPGLAERGRAALTQYACHACHMIPGVTGSRVYVGPPLQGIGGRALIAGRLPNSPANLALWVRDPRHVEPNTTMPVLGVPEQDALDIAAYLQTLH
jgi:mono/diheme cytochrome c family protein